MPIDPDFKSKRKVVDKHQGHDVYGPVEPPEILGIHGSNVSVDFDICIADGICIDVCPVNALYLGEDGRVYVNDMFCIYCGACVNVCQKPEALELNRTSVRHTPIKSGMLSCFMMPPK
jgi:NAD-dependent dihydropyrimidine dehydrogenase PreA subunit